MSKVRVVFLGTPEFAVTSLKRLIEDEHYDVVGVVTQPDRPAGRKMQLLPSAVKSFAQSKNIPVITPESVNKDFILSEIKTWSAEIAVVVAFGQILSQKFLDLFPLGAVNIHGSVLPQWRGAAPIQRAIEAGDLQSGVTLQKIVRELDAGDILGIRRLPLDENINAKQLHDQLAVLGADLLHVELMDYIRGNLVPIPQDHDQATYAKKIDKSESEIHWSDDAEHIHNKIRAFVMGPGTWVSFHGKKLKLHKTELAKMAPATSAAPGQIVDVNNQKITLATGRGCLDLLEVQPESRNRMPIAEFLKSNPLKVGDLLG